MRCECFTKKRAACCDRHSCFNNVQSSKVLHLADNGSNIYVLTRRCRAPSHRERWAPHIHTSQIEGFGATWLRSHMRSSPVSRHAVNLVEDLLMGITCTVHSPEFACSSGQAHPFCLMCGEEGQTRPVSQRRYGQELTNRPGQQSFRVPTARMLLPRGTDSGLYSMHCRGYLYFTVLAKAPRYQACHVRVPMFVRPGQPPATSNRPISILGILLF